MFKDRDWVYKLGILVLLYAGPGLCISFNQTDITALKAGNLNLLLSNLLPCILLSAIMCPFIFGYLSKCTHNVIKNNWGDPLTLPNWEDDFLNYFALGIKRGFAIFLIILLLIPGSVLLFIPFLIYGFITFALDNIFCTNFKLNSYFKWGRAFKIISSDYGLYVNALAIIFVMGLLAALIQFLCSYYKLPNTSTVFIQAICSIYVSLVTAYLIGMFGVNEEDEIPQ